MYQYNINKFTSQVTELSMENKYEYALKKMKIRQDK